MKLKDMALLAVLGAALATPAFSQPAGAQGMGPGSGRGPGEGGMGMRFQFDKDNTRGWALMTPEERAAHSGKMHSAKSYEECKALQSEHHQAMEARAKEKGVTLPSPGANGCDRMKARGFFK
jgi:hypothetical protein